MAQLNLYVPDDFVPILKKEAQKHNTSVSTFVYQLIQEKIKPRDWNPDFLSILGTWEGDFPTAEELKLEDREKW